MASARQKMGYAAEQSAFNFLAKQGLTFLEQNYQCEFGEIDLILKDQEYIVFVEVRSRKPNQYTSALESIGLSKQNKIIKTALYFLIEKNWLNKVDCRFDIIAIDGLQIDWIKNAFNLDNASI